MPQIANTEYLPKKPRGASAVVILPGGRKIKLWTICAKLAPLTNMTAKHIYVMLRFHMAKKADPKGKAWGIQRTIASELGYSETSVSHLLAQFNGRKIPSPDQLSDVWKRKDFSSRVISTSFKALGDLVLLGSCGMIDTNLTEQFRVTQNLFSTHTPELGLIIQGEVEGVEFDQAHRGGEKNGPGERENNGNGNGIETGSGLDSGIKV